MKTLYQFLLFFLLLSVTTLPQNRISETNNRNFKELKTALIKFERSNGVETFREKQMYENNIDEKTVINRKLLGNGFLLIEFSQQWDGSAWVNIRKDLYTYDGNNNLTEWLVQKGDGSAWVDGGKISYTYDENNNLTEELNQSWNGSAWVDGGKISYTYDENNNLTEELGQTLAIEWKNIYTYDENNNQTERLGQVWDGSWVNSFKITYTYSPATAINENFNSISSYNLSNNYPNPFNPTTKINYSIPHKSNVEIKVYDILGKELTTLVSEEKSIGNYEVEFDGSDLSSGVYFYRLQAGSFVETKKMVLMK